MAPTDPTPPDATEQEMRLITLALNARGWIVTDLRRDGQTVHLYARRDFPHADLTIADVDRER